MFNSRSAVRVVVTVLLACAVAGWSAQVEAFAQSANKDQRDSNQEKKQEPKLKVLHKVDPVYPDEAMREGVTGKVILDVTIEETGEVSIVKVLDGHRLLNQAAIDAMKQWRFSNAYGNAITIQMSFNFNDGDEPAPAAEQRGIKNVHKVDAVYPEEAKRKGIQGEVVVEINVNKNGEVTDARAKSGDEMLQKAAVDAAKQFRFSNTLEKEVVAQLTFNFVLGDKDKQAPRKPLL